MPLLHTKPATQYSVPFQFEAVSEVRGVILAVSPLISPESLQQALTFLQHRQIWIALLTGDDNRYEVFRSQVQYAFLLDERVPLLEVLAECVAKSMLPPKHILTVTDHKRILGLAQQQGTQAVEVTTAEQLLQALAKYLP